MQNELICAVWCGAVAGVGPTRGGWWRAAGCASPSPGGAGGWPGSPVRAEGRDRLRGEARYLLILVVRDHHGIRSWPPATDDAMPASSAASRLASAMPDGLQIGNPVDLTFKVSTTQPAAPTDIGGDYSLLT